MSIYYLHWVIFALSFTAGWLAADTVKHMVRKIAKCWPGGEG